MPTFSMKSSRVSARSMASSAFQHLARSRGGRHRPSRPPAPGASVWRARRSASFCVCTSPVTTAMPSSSPNAASVRSSSIVFPDPGDDTRLKAVTPCSARRRADLARQLVVLRHDPLADFNRPDRHHPPRVVDAQVVAGAAKITTAVAAPNGGWPSSASRQNERFSGSRPASSPTTTPTRRNRGASATRAAPRPCGRPRGPRSARA